MFMKGEKTGKISHNSKPNAVQSMAFDLLRTSYKTKHGISVCRFGIKGMVCMVYSLKIITTLSQAVHLTRCY
jgi:hypothetical protein